MIANKIKSFLKLRNIKAVDYSNAIELKNAQALNTKYIRESFKFQEIITLAYLGNCKLAFIDEDNKPIIIFDESDLKPKE